MSDVASNKIFNDIVNLVSKLNDTAKKEINKNVSENLANEFNEVFKLQGVIRNLEKENAEVKKLNQELITAKNQIIKRNNELASENIALNDKKMELGLKIVELETAHKELNENLDELEDDNSKLNKENNYLEMENLKSNNKIVDLENTLEEKIKHEQNLMSECNEAKAVVFNLKQQLNDLNKNTDNLKIIELQTTVGSLKIQLTESLSNSMKWKNEVENKDWELKEIQHSLDSYTKADKELREQNVQLKEENNNLHKKLNDSRTQNNEINIVKEKATEVLYKKSSEVFGNKHIFEQTIEEMAELMVEINKVRRVNEGFDLTKINNLPQIMEEVCDVQMCLNHLKILFNETDFKNIQVKKFNKFTDHFKKQFNKKENEKKLNDLISNPETKNHAFISLDINEDQLFAESVNGCP